MDGFLKVAGAAQVCQDDKLDEARRKQDAAQAAFSTLQTIGKYLSAIKRRITAFTKFYEASPPRDFSYVSPIKQSYTFPIFQLKFPRRFLDSNNNLRRDSHHGWEWMLRTLKFCV